MPRVMAVAFEPHGQLHYLNPGSDDYAVGDWVLYPTKTGPEVARVIWGITTVADGDFPICEGPATHADISRAQTNRMHRIRALAVAKRLVSEHQLDMKVVALDWIDRAPEVDLLVAIYFQAPKRVDFRELVVDLARALHARIDLRQVGDRDATRLCGGVGNCGRELCCCTFLNQFEPINMRLAKVQGVHVNPLLIAGQCGKLQCCLRYEMPQYRDFAKTAPEVGAAVLTPEGRGKVIGHQVPAEAVLVQYPSGEVASCPVAEARKTGLARFVAKRPTTTPAPEDEETPRRTTPEAPQSTEFSKATPKPLAAWPHPLERLTGPNPGKAEP